MYEEAETACGGDYERPFARPSDCDPVSPASWFVGLH
jgi:hypothetical protein